jgi:hypothetical protein
MSIIKQSEKGGEIARKSRKTKGRKGENKTNKKG